MRLLLVVLLSAVSFSASAQPDCTADYEQALSELEAFQPRTADSLATAAVRASLQEARACFAALPRLDSTAANHFARTYGREVQVLWETRRPEQATALTEAFLSGPHLRADSSGVRYLLEWRAFILEQQGEFEAASRTFVQLLDYAPSESPAVRTRIWMSLGANYGRLGWWDDALAIYRSVQDELGDAGELEPQLRINLARSLSKEAETLLYQRHLPGNVERSIAAAERSVALLRQGDSSRDEHYRVFALLTLGEAQRFADRPDSALVVLQDAVALASRLERPSLTAEVLGHESLGRTLIQLDRFDEAARAFERSLELAETSGAWLSQLGALEGLSQALIHQDDFVRADSFLTRMIDIVEAERAEMTASTEASRSDFWYPYYLTRVSSLLRQGRSADAFLALDQARARVLRDLRDHRASGLAPDDRRTADSLLAAVGQLHRRLATPGLSLAEEARLRGQVAELSNERAELFEVASAAPDVTVPRLQQALADRGQVMVTYHLKEPAHAFVLRPDTLIAVPLGASANYEEVRALLGGVSTQWVQADGPLSVADASFELRPLKRLYDLFFAPIAEHVPEGMPLVVVPEGPLAQLPFGLLLESDPGRFQFASAPFLLRRHPISMELAAALLLDAPRVRPEAPLVAFGRSEFGGLSASSPSRSAAESDRLPDLPSVAQEMAALARRFPDALVALNGEATETSFYRHAPGARLLHLASHAFVVESDPLNSFLQLTPDSTEDGRLHLHELADLDLPASLVVLSGCRTARGRDLLGEGTQGLHYAVRAAGAESSLGMLWRVDDAATVTLMEAFYEQLALGARKDVALQQAQLAYLNDAEGLRSSPFFWGAPVLYGTPSPVDLPPAPRSWGWWAIGGVLLLLALSARRFLRPTST